MGRGSLFSRVLLGGGSLFRVFIFKDYCFQLFHFFCASSASIIGLNPAARNISSRNISYFGKNQYFVRDISYFDH